MVMDSPAFHAPVMVIFSQRCSSQIWRQSARGSSFQAHHDHLDRARPGTSLTLYGNADCVFDCYDSR